MLSLRTFKVLFFLGALNVWTTSVSAAASNLTYETAKNYLDSLGKTQIADKVVFAPWKDSIRVSVRFDEDKTLKQHVLKQVEFLKKEINELDISLANNNENFIIELLDDNAYYDKVNSLNIKGPLVSLGCAAGVNIVNGYLNNANILVKKNYGNRQKIIHCVSYLMLKSLGLSDNEGNGLLLSGSSLGPDGGLSLGLRDLDIIVIKYFYAKEEDKKKYISLFQEKATFNDEVYIQRESIKKSISYIYFPSSSNLPDSKEHIINIFKIKDKKIIYSYLSSLTILNFNITNLDQMALEGVLNFCRDCYFSLLSPMITPYSDERKNLVKHYAEDYIKNYNTSTDNILIYAGVIFYQAFYDLSNNSSREKLLKAMDIYKEYYGEKSNQVIFTRHALSRWYFIHNNYQTSAAGLLENQKLFDGTVIGPLLEGVRFLEGVEVFMKAGMVEQAQANLDAAYSRFQLAKRPSDLAQMQKVKQRFNLH